MSSRYFFEYLILSLGFWGRRWLGFGDVI
jgi:hypothetical protein